MFLFIYLCSGGCIYSCLSFCQKRLFTAENMSEFSLRPVVLCSAGWLIIPSEATSTCCILWFSDFIFCLISWKALTTASGGGVSPLVFDVDAAKKSFILIREAVCSVKAVVQRLCVSWKDWTEPQNNLKSHHYGIKPTLKRSRCSFFV